MHEYEEKERAMDPHKHAFAVDHAPFSHDVPKFQVSLTANQMMTARLAIRRYIIELDDVLADPDTETRAFNVLSMQRKIAQHIIDAGFDAAIYSVEEDAYVLTSSSAEMCALRDILLTYQKESIALADELNNMRMVSLLIRECEMINDVLYALH
jgi:hypothetical protein